MQVGNRPNFVQDLSTLNQMDMKSILRALLVPGFVIMLTATNAQITKLSNNTNIEHGAVAGNHIVMVDKNGLLWTTDATAAGTVQFTSKVSYDSTGGIAIFNSKIYFSGISSGAGSELWVTDGTDAGTSLVKDINAGAPGSSPKEFNVFGNTIFFIADDGTHGIELWKSDGTTGGTVLVKDINPGSANGVDSSSIFFQNNNTLFFSADDGTNGTELWKTDGSSAGTVMIKDITAGSGSTQFEQITALGSATIFDRIVGSPFTGQYELWTTDGTTSGTTLLKNFGNFSASHSAGFVHYNSKLYFTATDFTNTGTELWSTDGTSGGTALLKDIYPGTTGSYPLLFNSVTINNNFLFDANTAASGTELWASDGTGSGTNLLKDINPGSGSADPIVLPNYTQNSNGLDAGVLFNGRIFLIADDGTHGQELWITDGTAGGTSLVKDINPGATGGLANTTGYFYTSAALYFTADDGTSGNELWKSDGSSGGTSLVKDINSGATGSDPEFMGILNQHLYFTADDGDNANGDRDLYIVDGLFFTLPIHLVNFNAVPAGKGVALNWATASEINSRYFSVERSLNGVNFATIGQVPASGNSNSLRQYDFQDNHAYEQNASLLYYRLKMVDKDGSAAYSSVAAVRLAGTFPALQLSPDPVKDQLAVDFKSVGAKRIAIRITDASGRQLSIKNITPGADAYRQVINVSSFSKGVYYLQLISDQSQTTTKFVKE